MRVSRPRHKTQRPFVFRFRFPSCRSCCLRVRPSPPHPGPEVHPSSGRLRCARFAGKPRAPSHGSASAAPYRGRRPPCRRNTAYTVPQLRKNPQYILQVILYRPHGTNQAKSSRTPAGGVPKDSGMCGGRSLEWTVLRLRLSGLAPGTPASEARRADESLAGGEGSTAVSSSRSPRSRSP